MLLTVGEAPALNILVADDPAIKAVVKAGYSEAENFQKWKLKVLMLLYKKLSK